MFESNLMNLIEGERIITRSRSRPYRPIRRLVFPELRKQLSPLKLSKPQLTSLTELVDINQFPQFRRQIPYGDPAFRVEPVREMMVVASKCGRTKNPIPQRKYETNKSVSTYAEDEIVLQGAQLVEGYTLEAEDRKDKGQRQQTSHVKSKLYNSV